MNFTNTETKTLLTIWKNLKRGLDKVEATLPVVDKNGAVIRKGTFKKVGPKGAAPPSEAGQTTLWFAIAIDQELTKRGVKH
jgi:hypothetical protein